MITCQINNQSLVTVYDEVVADSVKYLKASFTFSDDWNGYSRTVIFSNYSNNKVLVVTLIDGDSLYLGNNTCYVPHEVIESPGFSISVFGIKDEGIITTDEKNIVVKESGYKRGEVPEEPTPTDVERIIGIATSAKNVADSVRDDADAGEFNGEKGDKGDKGDTYAITPADYDSIATIVKEEIVIPTKTSDLTNDSGFITNTVSNLANYYLKTETYTKSEVQNLIGQISTVQLLKVNVLPQTGQSGIIYLVPNQTQEQNNIFDEYIYVDNAWELIGTTEVDLAGYATKTWVSTQISDFLTQSEITNLVDTALANYYTMSEVNSMVNSKVSCITGSSVPTASTVAPRVGTLYLDTAHNDTYQCTGITTENNVTTYTWAKLLRNADLGNYYDIDTTDYLLGQKANSSALANYITNSDCVAYVSEQIVDKAANVIKLNVSGTDSVVCNYVSPLEHDVTINVASRNLYKYDDVITTPAEVTRGNDGWITITGDNTNGTDTKFINYSVNKMAVKPNTTYAVVTEVQSTSGSGHLFNAYARYQISNKNVQYFFGAPSDTRNLVAGDIKAFKATTPSDPDSKTAGCNSLIYFSAGESGSITMRLSVVELKDPPASGDTVTTINGVAVNDFEYTAYVNPSSVTITEETSEQSATADADGTVSGITSVSPTMTLTSDTDGVDINVEYHADTKAYVDTKTDSDDVIKDVKVNGTSLTRDANGAVDIPQASNTQMGVVGVVPNNGVSLTKYSFYNIPILRVVQANDAALTARAAFQNANFGVITTGNYQKAVKFAMCDGVDAAWTDAEKNGAWARLSIIKTTMDAVAVPNAQYFLGEQSSLSITLPSTGLAVGQEILVCFSSGAIACSLTVNLTGFSFVPQVNKTSWIKFTCYDATSGDEKWLVETKEG